MSIAHQHFLMSSNGGHMTKMIKMPNPIDPTSIKEGDHLVCWDDSGLAENPHIFNTPEHGKTYEVREVGLETFGIRFYLITNPEGPYPMEPGFEPSRFCTVDELMSSSLKMVKAYPHTRVKQNAIGKNENFYYATSYEVSFDDFGNEELETITGGGKPIASLRYDFEELTLNEPLEARSTFSVTRAFNNYNLAKHTQVSTKHLLGEEIDSTRVIVILQDVPGVSYEAHAKIMLLLWLLHDRTEIDSIDTPISLSSQIRVEPKEESLFDINEINHLFDFTVEKTIQEKINRILVLQQ